MNDKQYLADVVRKSELPQEVKNRLIQRIASDVATVEVAKEIADLLDLQADVLDMGAAVLEKQAQEYENLAGKLQRD